MVARQKQEPNRRQASREVTSASRRKPPLRRSKKRPRDKTPRYTLIHLPLPQDVISGVDTLLWLRVTAAGHPVEQIRGGKHRIYDEAVELFLSKYERRACGALKCVGTHGWHTVRVQSALIERCKPIARRAGVALGTVVSCALLLFVQSRVQPAWRDFRSTVREQARAVLDGASQRL